MLSEDGGTRRNNLRRIAYTIVLCAIFPLMHATNANAFGLKTHLWIGQSILKEVRSDCTVTLLNERYRLRKKTCTALKNHPSAFLSGTLGPDIYPDLIVGQTTTHPGVKSGWMTDQWLSFVLSEAKTEQASAFAFGYMVHAASDVMAHTYVNLYAGDEFVLFDEQAVELRHVALEKYIDERLPSRATDPSSLTIPSAELRDTLIFNSSAIKQYVKAGTGLHLVAMHSAKESVGGLDNVLEKIEDGASKLIAELVAETLDITARTALGETKLQILRESLRIKEQMLGAKRSALNAANVSLNGALDAVEQNEAKISELVSLADTKRSAAASARGIAQTASQQVRNFQSQLTSLQRRLAQTPPRIARQVCERARTVCSGPLKWISPTCHVIPRVCRTVHDVNSIFTNLSNSVASVRNTLNDASHRARVASADIARNVVDLEAAMSEKATKESLQAGLTITRTNAQAVVTTATTALTIEENLTREARRGVEAAEQEVEALREKLVNKNSTKRTIQSILDNANFLTVFTKNWTIGMNSAAEEYIKTSLQLSKNILNGDSKLIDLYKDWISCHGVAFMAVPYQAPNLACNVRTEYEKAKEQIDAIITSTLPPGMRELKRAIEDLKSKVRDEIEKELTSAGIELIKFASNAAAADFVNLLANPELATESKLNQIFSSTADAGSKKLLEFPKVSDLIHTDIGLSNGKLDPIQFKALDYGLTLSKLALLPIDSLNQLVRDSAGLFWLLKVPRRAFEGDENYSVLFKSIRSIDGNHQWMPYGLPFARQDGFTPLDPNQRRYGYGSNDGAGFGFKLFQNAELRKHVFLKLFPKPVAGEIIKRPELEFTAYPFPTCDRNPFPVSFDELGNPVSDDLKCND